MRGLKAQLQKDYKFTLHFAKAKSNTNKAKSKYHVLIHKVFGALSSEQKLLQATLVWLAVCYSPGDLVHSIVKNKV